MIFDNLRVQQVLPTRTRRALFGALSALLVSTLPVGTVRAAFAPPGDESALGAPSLDPQVVNTPAAEQEAYGAQLASAVEAWSAGEWSRARSILGPLVESIAEIDDPFERERVLRFMADSTLLDGELDPPHARQRARDYVGRLLDNDPQWSPPPGAHSDQLYVVTEELKQARREERAAACEAELVACGAGAENERTLRKRLQTKYEKLQADYDDEIVIVTDRIALNRAVAIVPFGIGHFYNRNNALGATFLSSELAFGGAGLGLMLYRIFGLDCARTNGFQPGSLVCIGKENRELGKRVRNAEQTFGILFVGTMLFDVVLAQILFKSSRVVGQRPVRRGDLRALGIDASELDSIEPEPEAPAPQSKPSDGSDESAKVELRPTTTVTRGGAGFGLRLRF